MSLDQARMDAGSPEQTLAPRGGVLRRHAVAIAAPLIYLAGSIWQYFPLVQHFRSAQMGGPDTSLFTWWLGWTPYAISHGHSPFVSTWVNSPHGVNAMWNTSVPLLGLIMAPVTETLGPVASVNVLLVLAPALSAWAAFYAAGVLELRQRSAFLIGCVYGFSSYDLAQDASGHLHLSMAVFPPLVAALLYKIVDGSVGVRKGGLMLGLAGVLQIWVSEEILATSGVVAAVTLAILAVRAPRARALEIGRRLAHATGWALVVVLPLAAPALIVQFFGRGHLTAGVNLPPLSGDLLTSIVPTHQVLIGKLVPGSVIERIQSGNYDEITGYVSLPLIVLLFSSRRRIRASKLHWCWTPMLIAYLLSFGWTLRVAGQPLGLRGPGQVTARLPLLSSILTPRFSLYVVLFAGLLLGVAWDSASLADLRTRRWTAVGVGLTVVALLPWPSAQITRITEPTAFSSGRALPGLPDGATVAILPWPTTINDEAMRWQAVDDYHFRLVGAYGIVAGAHGGGDYGTRRPTLDRVAHHLSGGADTVPPAGGAEERQELSELAQIKAQATALIIGPYGDTAAIAEYVGGLLHQTPDFVGGVYIFRLRGTRSG